MTVGVTPSGLHFHREALSLFPATPERQGAVASPQSPAICNLWRKCEGLFYSYVQFMKSCFPARNNAVRRRYKASYPNTFLCSSKRGIGQRDLTCHCYEPRAVTFVK